MVHSDYATTTMMMTMKDVRLVSPRNSAIADKPRDAFRDPVKFAKHGTVPYVRYGFLLQCYSNFRDIRLQKWRDLDNRIRGP